MATKKTEVKSETAEQLLEQPEEKQEKKTVDPWDEQVAVIVPRKPKGEDQQFYVCVNDRRFMIPANGKEQLLPKPIAEVLLEAIEADYEAQDFAENIPNRNGENPQVHAI